MRYYIPPFVSEGHTMKALEDPLQTCGYIGVTSLGREQIILHHSLSFTHNMIQGDNIGCQCHQTLHITYTHTVHSM
ncbi:hypothetical protein XELAEV_18035341mg [Xenopus laevis]|uniref:Uncharacterized protein n=1 Tax=Xenopus laevis TaxID=8355 RepID=A0A974HC14_XENLA|nr:hypothetical protein XELAEV_18035341mg [Xenopus laevis]